MSKTELMIARRRVRLVTRAIKRVRITQTASAEDLATLHGKTLSTLFGVEKLVPCYTAPKSAESEETRC